MPPAAMLGAALAEALRCSHLTSVAPVVKTRLDRPACEDSASALCAPLELVAGHDGLLFRCAHQLMDAEGLAFFATEFFRALHGLTCVGSHPVPVPLASGSPVAKFAWPSAPAPFNRSANGSGTTHAELKLCGQFPSPGATIMAALAKHCHNAAVFMVPIDLRQTESLERSTANASNALFIQVAQGAPATVCLENVVRKLADDEQAQMSPSTRRMLRLPIPVLRPLLRMAHAGMRRRNRWLASALISNVGPISLAELSGGGFRATWARLLPFDMPGVALSVVTLRHSAGLSVALSAPGQAPLDDHVSALRQALSPVAKPSPSLWPALAHAIAHHADSVALVENDQRVTYRELGQQAEALAAELVARGLTPASRVLINDGRSKGTVVAMLACLRQGIAFVPTDPDWPAARIDFIAKDSQASLQLGGAGEPIDDLIHQGRNKPTPEPSTSRVAYILYTSGSTGQPKGVVVGGASLAQYIQWAASEYLKGEPATFAFFTSPAFDLTLTTLFVPLTVGGAVKVFQGGALDTAAQLANDTEVTALKLTPAHLKLLVSTGALPASVKTLVVGGEALTTHLARQVGPQAAIYNEYGPTEATVGCVVHKFNPVTDLGPEVPIGLPIPGTELHLELEGRAPAPGEYGELILSGDSLALGYLTAAQEANKFITLADGRRGYRTGDLVRWNGQVFEYGGRIDRQVKLGGRRVELGEIEAIAEASGLCNTFVAYVESSPSGLRLKGRAELLDAAQLPQLKAHLVAELPPHMVPDVIHVATADLTANLKVNRPSLEAPTTQVPAAPLTDILATLRGLLAEVTDGAVSFAPAQESLTRVGLDSLQVLNLILLAEAKLQAKPDHDRLARFAANPTLETLASTFLHDES